MNERIKLTKTTVRALEAGPTEYLVWDRDLPRFGVRVKPSGTKTFIVQYRTDGRQRRRKIGNAKIVSADAARDKARRYLADVELDNDPATRKDQRASDPIFRDFCVRYAEEYAAHHLRARTRKEYRNLIRQVKAWRRQAGELRAASFFIDRMCSAAKDRTCDDLLALADWAPSLRTARAAFREEKLPLNLQLIATYGCITPEIAIAIWQRIGSRRYRAENIPTAPGCYQELLNAYETAGYPQHLIELCRLGLTRMSFALPAYLPAVYVAAGTAVTHAVTSRPSPSIQGIPAFVYDWFTRSGREAIRLWTFSNSGLHPAMRWFEIKADPVRAAAMAVFQLEGGRVNFELSWPGRQCIADQTTVALLTSAGLTENKVAAFMALCRERLSILDEIRATVVARRNGQLFLPLEDHRDV